MRRMTGAKQFGREDRNDRPSFKRSSGSFEKRMHTVICDKCGDECEVPFRPTGDKPVYCSACFRKNEKPSSRRDEEDESFEFDEINQKLDKIMRALNIE